MATPFTCTINLQIERVDPLSVGSHFEAHLTLGSWFSQFKVNWVDWDLSFFSDEVLVNRFHGRIFQCHKGNRDEWPAAGTVMPGEQFVIWRVNAYWALNHKMGLNPTKCLSSFPRMGLTFHCGLNVSHTCYGPIYVKNISSHNSPSERIITV